MSSLTIQREIAETSTPDIVELIRARRSVGKVLPDCPPREMIEELLEAATWAPNHHVTEPWRFVVIAGEAREAFGDAMAIAKCAGMDPAVKDLDAEYARAKNKALRAPVIIAVVAEVAGMTKGNELEEITATASAVQNLLLVAHARGLGAIWRTGDPAYADGVKQFLGFTPADHIIGFVYLGYPATEPTRSKHTPATELTRWLGWAD